MCPRVPGVPATAFPMEAEATESKIAHGAIYPTATADIWFAKNQKNLQTRIPVTDPAIPGTARHGPGRRSDWPPVLPGGLGGTKPVPSIDDCGRVAPTGFPNERARLLSAATRPEAGMALRVARES